MSIEQNIHDLKMAVLEQAVRDWCSICARGVYPKTYEGMCRVKSKLRQLRRFFDSNLCEYYADGIVPTDVIIEKMENIYSRSKCKKEIEDIEQGENMHASSRP